MKSKTQKILEHLQRGDTLSTWQAIQEYRATRLSAVIYSLRNRGYQIANISTTKSGHAVYKLLNNGSK
ncbi:helix-turn-helix domain-containing protein [Francisella philomiragia]|uniref:helix-turn-helix domain-containing protein n=1 Tax=Francisella philomiragia TaxID=28110 RepID=UPI003519A799